MRTDDKTEVHSKRGEEEKQKQKVGIRKKREIIGEEGVAKKWNGGKQWALGSCICLAGSLFVATRNAVEFAFNILMLFDIQW